MEIVFEAAALEDLAFWKSSNNESVLKRIRLLLENICDMPFAGIGKPEALRHELTGKWSRRINEEHRIVYGIEGNLIRVYQLRHHY